MKKSSPVLKGKESLSHTYDAQRRLEGASVKAAKMEEAEKRATEAAQKISIFQAEISRLEKVEARSEAEIKSLKEQNAALIKKADLLALESKEAAVQIARLETKLEAQATTKKKE